jgi:hypothetical protein
VVHDQTQKILWLLNLTAELEQENATLAFELEELSRNSEQLRRSLGGRVTEVFRLQKLLSSTGHELMDAVRELEERKILGEPR